MEAPPPRPLTIVALVINRQRTHRGRPAAEMSACSRGYQEDNSRLWRSYQVVDSRCGGEKKKLGQTARLTGRLERSVKERPGGFVVVLN